MIVVDCLQRSPEWRAARCGHVTASRAADVLAGGRGRSRLKYLRQLVREQLTGIPEDPLPRATAAMRRGARLEPAARAAYTARTGQAVAVSGFVLHDTLRAGCSLDGIVAGGGIVEIKAPNTATHLRYLLRAVARTGANRVPGKYRAQIVHHLWITGAPWCEFVSFDDRLPAPGRLLIVRVHRDQVDIPGYARAVRELLEEIDGYVAPLAPVAAYFRAAPLHVATRALELCRGILDDRRRAA